MSDSSRQAADLPDGDSSGDGTESVPLEQTLATGDSSDVLVDPDDILPDIPSVEIRREIGRGGMGVVFEARQTFLERDVAVKVLRESASTSEFSRRFQREAKLLALLSHPNVVSCYHAGTLDSGQCFLVMEYIDGPNLLDHVDESGPLEPRAVVILCRELARALGYAYSKGLIHRDVKPANVLLQPRDGSDAAEYPFRTKLVDLGLARPEVHATADMGLTVPGAILGSPATMAPEQFNDPENVDYRADIYGLGCVLYYALFGDPAFPEKTLADLVLRKLSNAGFDLKRAPWKAVPAPLGKLVVSMLACKREDRPQSYAEILDRCEAILNPNAGQPEPRSKNSALLPLAAVGLLVVAAGTWGATEYFGGGNQLQISDPAGPELPPKTWSQILEQSLFPDEAAELAVGATFEFEVKCTEKFNLAVEDDKGEQLWSDIAKIGTRSYNFEIAPQSPRETRSRLSLTLVVQGPEGQQERLPLGSFDVVDPVPGILDEYRSGLLEELEDPASVPDYRVLELKERWSKWRSTLDADERLLGRDRIDFLAENEVDAWGAAMGERLNTLPTPQFELSLADGGNESALVTETEPGQPALLYSRRRMASINVLVTGALSPYAMVRRDSGEAASEDLVFNDAGGQLVLDLTLVEGQTETGVELWDPRGDARQFLRFVLDQDPPTIITPSNQKRLQSSRESLVLELRDEGAGVAGVSWRRTEGDDATGSTPFQADANGSWSADIPLELGLNEIEVSALDKVGNPSDTKRFGFTRLPSAPLSGIDPIMSVLLADGMVPRDEFVAVLDGPVYPKGWDIPPEWEFYSTGIPEENRGNLVLDLPDSKLRLVAIGGQVGGEVQRVAATTELPVDELWSLRGSMSFPWTSPWPEPDKVQNRAGRVAIGTLDGTVLVFEFQFKGDGGKGIIESKVFRWNAHTLWDGREEVRGLRRPVISIGADQERPTTEDGVDFMISLGKDRVELVWGPKGSLAGPDPTGLDLIRETLPRDELGWTPDSEAVLVLQSESGNFTFESLGLLKKE